MASSDPASIPAEHQTLLAAFAQLAMPVALYDADDLLRYANEAFDALFLRGLELPVTFADMYRHSFHLGIGSNIDCGDIELFLAKILPRRRQQPVRHIVTDAVDGRWLQFTEQLLPGGWMLTVGSDITALKHNERSILHARAEAEQAALTDALTGLPNRRHATVLARQALAAQAAGGPQLTLALVDLDHFKRINDAYGHSAGDAALQHFARHVRRHLRAGDHCGRWGGEEFLLLLPGAELGVAVGVIERLRGLLSQQSAWSLTFSAGVTQAQSGESLETLLGRADEALYRAKGAGRNCTLTAVGSLSGF